MASQAGPVHAIVVYRMPSRCSLCASALPLAIAAGHGRLHRNVISAHLVVARAASTTTTVAFLTTARAVCAHTDSHRAGNTTILRHRNLHRVRESWSKVPLSPACALLCPVPVLFCSSPVRPRCTDATMPGEHGRVCDLRGLQPAAIPRCQCSYVSMISLAVSDFAVKDRDWCRETVLFCLPNAGSSLQGSHLRPEITVVDVQSPPSHHGVL
jgi:hypothetical protein